MDSRLKKDRRIKLDVLVFYVQCINTKLTPESIKDPYTFAINPIVVPGQMKSPKTKVLPGFDGYQPSLSRDFPPYLAGFLTVHFQ